MPTRQPSELFATWSPEGGSLLIEYDLRVLEEIRFLVVDGFNKVPHGGLEVGGVLFGTVEGSSVRISAFRELEIEHRSGPSFSLSEKDEAQLQKLLQLPDEDPELEGTQAVGWAHSHTRSEIHLSDADRALHDAYFPEPWQVALVLKPFKWDPTRAAFFARGADGTIATHTPAEEFEIQPLRGPVEADSPDVVEAIEDEVEVVSAMPSLPVAAVAPMVIYAPAEDDTRAFAPVPSPRRSRRRTWLALAAGVAALLAIAAGAASLLRRSADSPFRVQLADRNGQLLISWDRTADEVERAKGAQLAIQDGGQGISLELTPEQVRRGSVTYVRNSGSVAVRLRVEPQEGPVIEELASFIGPPVQREASEKRQEATPLDVSALPQKDALTAEPTVASERAVTQAEPETRSSPAPAEPAPKRFRPPPASAPRDPNQQVLADAPQIAAADLARGLALPGVRAPHLPAAPQTPPQQAPARAAEPPAPRSGRMIWTGQLKRGQYLSIDGTQCSTGFLTGQLPQVPVRVRIFPADLTEEGFQLFTSDPALGGRTEAPAAQNGWNRTRFLVDAKAAGGVKLIESPGSSNGWKRVVLQNSGREESAIVIQWQTM